MGTTEVFEIPLREIWVQPGFNCRRAGSITRTNTASLGESIREMGLIEPIVVQPVDEISDVAPPGCLYRLIAGERRYTAVQMHTDRKAISTLVRTGLGDKAAEINLIENIERQDLDILEEAEAIQQKWGDLPLRKVAKIVKRPTSWVAVRRKLVRSTEAVKRAAAKGEITQYELRAIFREPDNEHDDLLADLLEQKSTKQEKVLKGRVVSHRNRSKTDMIALVTRLLEENHPHAESLSAALMWAANEITNDDMEQRLGLNE